jgi:hypothetical protein
MKFYRVSYTVVSTSGEYRTSIDTYAYGASELYDAFSSYTDVSVTRL